MKQQEMKALINSLREIDIHLYTEGDSLKFKAAKGALTEQLKVQIKEYREDIIQYLKNQRQNGGIPKAPTQQYYPLSDAQFRLWTMQQIDDQSAAYHIRLPLLIKGQLNTKLLARAFEALIERHESLRTQFVIDSDGEPKQWIRDDQHIKIDFEDLSGKKTSRQLLEKRIYRLGTEPFDLEKDPLIRADLCQLSDNEHLLVMVMHHIISDGWSLSIMAREWQTVYEKLLSGEEHELPDLPIQYKDYAVWQIGRDADQSFRTQQNYWRKKLQDPPVLNLPTDKPRPAQQSFYGETLFYHLSIEETTALKKLCKQQNCSLFMAVTALTFLLIHKYTGQKDLILGTPGAGRNHPDLAGQIGFYLNTLAVRTVLDTQMTLIEFLKEIRREILETLENQDYPFDRVINALDLPRDLSRTPLFDVMIFMQNAGSLEMSFGDAILEPFIVDSGSSKTDLVFDFEDGDDELIFSINYNTDLYQKSTVDRMAGHLKRLAGILSNSSELILSEVDYLTGEDLTLIENINRTQTEEDTPHIIELIRDSFDNFPELTALLDESGSTFTYRELNNQSDLICNRLLSNGVKRGDVVAIALEPSPFMVIALLGIAKTGATWFAVDVTFPDDRIEYMLSDSGSSWILSNQKNLKRFHYPENDIVSLDIEKLISEKFDPSIFYPTLQKEDIAYIIYTSGSTGRPKGVPISHGALSNFILAMKELLHTDKDSVIPLLTTISFDISYLECFLPLISGGAVQIVSRETAADGIALSRFVKENRLTHIQATPATWQMLTDTDWKGGNDLTLITGGEALTPDLAKKLKARCGDLWNMYGPTEATVWCTTLRITESEMAATGDYLSIGNPIRNTNVYILDEHQMRTPPGVPGELYIGGIGLADGYHNRPELTAEKFVFVKFQEGSSQKLYRTGDLVKMRFDGNLEFLGRLDHQIKLNGFRIELGEIESCLSNHEAIQHTAVTLYTNGSIKQLLGYVKLEDSSPLKGQSDSDITQLLKNFLKQTLPAYMVPSKLIILDKIPLTIAGKVDRKALPAPDSFAEEGKESGTPVQTDMEILLSDIWSDLLQKQIQYHEAHFFELGGHSLLATRMAWRIRQHLKIDLPLKILFRFPVLSELAKWLETAKLENELPPIERLTNPRERTLSFAQKRLWFLHKFEGASSAYNMPVEIQLNGDLNTDILRESFQVLIKRHESLRICFPDIDGVGIIKDLENYDPLSFVDFSGLPTDERSEKINKLKYSHASDPFNLETGPLLRMMLLILGERKFELLFNMHHIISDGWSMEILVREFCTIYDSLLKSEIPKLPSQAIQYSDVAVWQNKWLEGEKMEGQRAFWKEELKDAETILQLPTDYPRPAVQSYRGSAYRTRITTDQVKKLKSLSKEENSSLFMILFTLFSLLLHRYSRQEDLIIGTPVAGRRHPQTENLIGLFVNTVVLRTRFKSSGQNGNRITFRNLLKEVHETSLRAFANQDLPFEEIIEEVAPDRDLSRSPLFQVMFAMHNNQESELKLHNLDIIQPEQKNSVSKFDLTLNATESDQGVHLGWEFATDLFHASTIERMASHFQQLIKGICSDMDINLQDLAILTDKDTEQLSEWNQTGADFSDTDSIVSEFENQVLRSPDSTAIRSEWFDENHDKNGRLQITELSYAELNHQANRLAHFLKEHHQAGKNRMVGIYCNRSVEMVAAIMGVLKSGSAYVPIDPSYPAERISYMIEDSGIDIILSHSNLKKDLLQLFNPGIEILCLDDPELLEQSDHHNPDSTSSPEDPAYVIYTSGSTGKPKGVVVSRKAISNHMSWMLETFDFVPSDKVLQKTPFSFDASVWEFYAPLLCGGTLVMAAPNMQGDIDYLMDSIHRNQITILQGVPSLLKAILNSYDFNDTGIRLLFSGGEPLTRDIVDKVLTEESKITLCNLYGPTEATIDTTYWIVDKDLDYIPIGRPISNLEVHILDEMNRPLPPGVPGELCITGAGLANGYINRPDLTSEKFQTLELFGFRKRAYKSGDLARWRSNGTLEFMGRIDDQFKLRGFRIEPDEIETVLLSHPDVREAAVAVRGDGDNRLLIGYLSLNKQSDFNSKDQHRLNEQLKNYLKNLLPEYMIPAVFILLDAIPHTPSGKIDRKRLPEPDFGNISVNLTGPAPLLSETEKLLAGIWSVILQKEIHSPSAHFFRMGGHSLLATRLISRIRRSFEIEISLRVLFETPVLKDLAVWIDNQQRGTNLPSITSAPAELPKQLSFAQQRFWFLWKLEGSTSTYNMPYALRLNGELDIASLEEAFRLLTQRHESLRMDFPESDGQVSVRDRGPYSPLTITDLTQTDPELQSDRVAQLTDSYAQESFNLADGPLLRVGLLVLKPDEHILMLNMHHIIADGWSVTLIVRELSFLYSELLQNKKPNGDNSGLQYSDFAWWQRHWLGDGELARQLVYWSQQMAGAPTLLKLPTDYPRPPVLSYRGDVVRTRLDKELTSAIHRLSREQGATLFMSLLAGYNVLLHRYSNQEDIIVGSPIAGRTRSQTEQMVGLFVNTLALRTSFETGQQQLTFKELLGQVRQSALGGYAHQDIPFEQLVEELSPQRSMSHSPLFQVMFVMQNNETAQLSLPGLNLQPVEMQHRVSKFDLTLIANESEQGLELIWEFATDLFREESIRRMARHFEQVLREVTANPKADVRTIDLLSEHEHRQLLNWNATERDFPEHTTLVELFELMATTSSGATALISENPDGDNGQTCSVSYRKLNEQANRLAHYLMEQHRITPGTIVGICAERTPEMVVGLLGILKAGGAYLPLDPQYPTDRLAYMIGDSGVEVVLTQQQILPVLEAVDTVQAERQDKPVVKVCLDSPGLLDDYNGENPPRQASPDDLAYVIYTSGSTGKPKGVMIEHRGVVNLALTQISELNIEPDSRILPLASLSFDASVWEIYAPLLAGAGLFLIPKKDLINRHLSEFLHQHKITHITVSPSLLAAIPEHPLPQLQTIIVAGEACSAALVDVWGANRRFINAYGPTEATVCATMGICTPGSGKPTIGRPIHNVQVHILDADNRPQPVGVPGELCIAGAGLARGYLNRDELTREKFIHTELLGRRTRLYRTGDLARWLDDGNIDFMGRIDDQVKLRGFRIEPGEIASTIMQHPDVADAVVMVRNDEGNPQLAAYLTVNPAAIPTATDSSQTPGGAAEAELAITIRTPQAEKLIAEVRNELMASLPDYMVPASFTLLVELPVTPNGKVNYKELPAPEESKNSDEPKKDPVSDVEKSLVQIWSGILGRDDIGIDNNFFNLGGDSIKAIQIVNKLASFGWKISVADIFTGPTIESLAAVAERLQTENQEEENVEGLIQHSPMQQWYLDYHDEGKHHFNQSVILESKEPIDPTLLTETINHLMERHHILRSRLAENNGEPVLTIDRRVAVDRVLEIRNFKQSDHPKDEAEQDAHKQQQSFDLTHGPLFKIILYQLGDSDHLFMVAHHMIVDAVSWHVIIEQLQSLYLQAKSGKIVASNYQTTSVKRWGEWLNSLKNKPFDTELKFWQQAINGNMSLTFFTRDKVHTFEKVRNFSFELNEELTHTLQSDIHNAFNTKVEDFLLAAITYSAKKWTDHSDLTILMEGHGRDTHYYSPDINQTIGWFTTIYPVSLSLSESEPHDHLKETKNRLRRVPDNGISFGVMAFLKKSFQFKSPLISFNYLGEFTDNRSNSDTLFTLSDLNSGPDVSNKLTRYQILEFSAIIRRGKLLIGCIYDPDSVIEEDLQTFMDDIQNELIHLISYCRSLDFKERTATDFSDKNLSDDDLDNIMDMFS